MSKFEILILSGFLAAPVVGAGISFDDIDRESLVYSLSFNFRSISCTNGLSLAVQLMDRPLIHISDGHEQGDQRCADEGEDIILRLGDSYRFFVTGGGRIVTLSLTNGITAVSVPRLPGDYCLSKLQLLINIETIKRSRKGDGGQASGHHAFLIDIPREKYYDIDMGVEGDFKMPFRALWKDWDDYLENFSGRPKFDIKKQAHRIYEIVTETLDGGKDVQDFIAQMTNGDDRVILYSRSEGWSGPSVNLAHVRKDNSGGRIEGLASFHGKNDYEIYIFDASGRMRWWSQYQEQCGFSYNYEFGFDGCIRRFTELDEEGRELLRRERIVKDGKMVDGKDRALFLAEIREVTRPFLDVWKNGKFEIVPAHKLPEKSAKEQETDRRVKEELARFGREQKKLREERNRKYEQINAHRRATGLSDLTTNDKWRMEREENLATRCRELEQLRYEATGRAETTERDKQIDRERTRLVRLFRIIRGPYAIIRNLQRDEAPTRLADVVGVKWPGRDYYLLPDGEAELRDVWGREYRYLPKRAQDDPNRDRPLITSAGPDGIFDTSDDLTSDDEILLRRCIKDKARGKEL